MIGRPRNKRTETSNVDKETAQMKAPMTHRNLPRFLGALAAAAACILALGAGSASAAFGIESFDGEVIQEGGAPASQAGEHPYEATTEFDLNSEEAPPFLPEGSLKNAEVRLPAGFIGNPRAVPVCTQQQFQEGGLVLGYGGTKCPPSSAVGTALLKTALIPAIPATVYNIVPGPNEPARFGFAALTARVNIHATVQVRPNGEYGLKVTIPDSSQGLPLKGNELRLWGVPSDESHDPFRVGPYEGQVRPFLSNPTSCVGPVATSLRINSWQEPGSHHEASFLSHNVALEPVGTEGCDKLSFEPSLSVQSDPPSAAQPTAISATVHVPQHNEDPNGLVTSHLKKAVVKLPPGVTINASASNGLGACSEAQFGQNSPDPASCPEDSKIGTGEVITPLLAQPMTGPLYQAQPGSNPFGTLLAVYMEVQRQGVRVKLAGRIDTDPVTGQVTTTFDNNPQVPFDDFKLNFFKGVLSNPNGCGDKTYTGSFDSWSGGPTVNTTSSFEISQNCATGGFNPSFGAASSQPVAGAYSPFSIDVARNDGEQNVAAIGVTLPKGLVAKIAGVPLCPEANTASASCPATSQIGRINIAAGTGPEPAWVPQPGKEPTAAYLAGPYKGAPYSLIMKVPVQAGPFDLGTAVVRATIQVNPETAQVSISSDKTIPPILKGVPLTYRHIQVIADRPGFMLNPTNCSEQGVASTIVSGEGAAATPASRFQVGSCGNLGLKPKLFTRIWGKTNRGAHPKFRAVLQPRSGDANLGRIALTLPRSEFLDQAHIKTICTRVQFAAGACPQGSVYGWAKAKTPLFTEMFEGPVYLRSSNHKLPDLVAALKGPVAFNLAGRIDSVNKGIRTTFESPPDVPVSKFILYMKGGKKGLLVNSRNICNATYRSHANLRGQNGRKKTLKPVLKNSRCKGKKKSK
jgi:hypothetical protein